MNWVPARGSGFVRGLSLTSLSFVFVFALGAHAAPHRQLSPQQLQATGFKTQADYEAQVEVAAVSLEESDGPALAYADILWPTPNQAPPGGVNPNQQIPQGTGSTGTWPPGSGGANQGQPSWPSGPYVPTQGSSGWMGAVQAMTGLDINGWIAIGNTIMNIIVANQPIANVSTPSLSILPQVQPHWSAMTGWSAPVVKNFVISLYNGRHQPTYRFLTRSSTMQTAASTARESLSLICASCPGKLT